MLESISIILKSLVSWVTENGSAVSKEDAHSFMESMFHLKLIQCLIDSMKTYGNNLTSLGVSAMINVLAELVLTQPIFLKQFVESRGLEVIDFLSIGVFDGSRTSIDHRHLNETLTLKDKNYRMDALVNGLLIASQLARNSEKYYELLINVFTPDKLVWMFTETIPAVRAKLCNLIGNLCRFINI